MTRIEKLQRMDVGDVCALVRRICDCAHNFGRYGSEACSDGECPFIDMCQNDNLTEEEWLLSEAKPGDFEL